MSQYTKLLEQVRKLCESHLRVDEKMSHVCNLLYSVENYDLVSYFFLDQERHDRLILGTYAGVTSPPQEILFSKGLCGQAAEREITIVQGDVSQELNYLRISEDVKSEIVLPLFRSSKLSGVLSIQSNELNYFDEHNRLFLEEVSLMLTD